jgi:hypothetical protein
MLGTRQRLMGALTSLVDGAGMPVDTGRMFADATAEAGRGLAPLAAAAAGGGLGARIGAKGAYGLLIGRRPDQEQLAKWQKPTGVEGEGDSASSGERPGGSLRRNGPRDRYRDDEGQVVDRNTGEVLHDQNTDRPLLSTRAHNRLVRFRGYRILNRGGRTAYGATAGLPVSVRRARQGGSRYTQDARQQVRVWRNTVREDGRVWGDAGRSAAQWVREHGDDRGGTGPFHSRRLPTGGPTARPGSSGPSGSAPKATPSAARRRLTDAPSEVRRKLRDAFNRGRDDSSSDGGDGS